MLIEIENTPNPATLKFLPGRSVMGSHPPLNFASCEDVAGRSALAESLFGLSDVKHVFLGHDFISVTKTDDADWASLRPVVLASLTSFLQSGQPLHSSLSLEEVIEETGALQKIGTLSPRFGNFLMNACALLLLAMAVILCSEAIKRESST